MSATLLTGARILLENGIVEGRALLIEGSRIAAVLPSDAAAAARMSLPQDTLLAPGFIDVQVNGGGGVQFNDAPTAAAARSIAAAHRRFGTTGLLPTLITDEPGLLTKAAEAVMEAVAQPGSGILGVHFEGPFLSPARPGVHQPRLIRTPEPADLALLTGLAHTMPGGRVVVTLAPEEVADAALAALAGAGVILCAGHSIASFERMTGALAAGLRGFTHLFNAMPPPAAREPGVVAGALLDGQSWCGVIADGVHVHPAMLRLALQAKGPDRVFLVTDAMAPTGTEMTGFLLNGRPIQRAGGRLTTADGTLAGADTDMVSCVRNCVAFAGLSLETALRMASSVPADFLRLGDRTGRIAPGLQADLVLLSARTEVLGTWCAGEWRAN